MKNAVESFFVVQGNAGAVCDVYITEIVTPSHPSFDRLKADSAFNKELNSLLDMNAVDIFLASLMPEHANVFGTRILLSIKEYDTKEDRWKSRIVVQGCMERESKEIVSDAGCVASMSVLMLLILYFSLGYSIWTRDVKQAYLQGGK